MGDYGMVITHFKNSLNNLVHCAGRILKSGILYFEDFDREGFSTKGDCYFVTDLYVTVTRPLSQASFATVLRFIRRETFKYLSSLIFSTSFHIFRFIVFIGEMCFSDDFLCGFKLFPAESLFDVKYCIPKNIVFSQIRIVKRKLNICFVGQI